MKRHVIFLIALMLTSLVSLQVAAQQKVNRVIGSFEELSVSGSFNVILTKGDKESVQLELKNIDPEKVRTEVKDGTLKIWIEKGNYNNATGKIYVTYRNINSISNSGSSNFRCDSPLEASNFEIRNSGSGDMRLASVDASSLNLSVSGSGNVTINKGEVKDQKVAISGSSEVNTLGLKSQKANISISGSGDLKLYVTDRLDASISGSGAVQYKGNPKTPSVRVAGSGSVSKI